MGKHDVGRYVYMPGRYVVCFHVYLSPEAIYSPDTLASILNVFAEENIPVVHLVVSRPEQGRPGEAAFFTDLTDSLSDEAVAERLRGMGFVKDVKVIKPLFDGFTMDTLFYPLTIREERAVVFRKTMYEAFLRRLRERLGTSQMAVLYHIGLEVGYAIYGELSRMTGGELDRIVMLGREYFKHSGLGVLEPELNLARRRAIVRIYGCFECELFKGLDRPASQFVRGMVSGFMSGVFGEKMFAEEIRCIAKGDEYCEFHVKQSKRIFLY